MSLNRIRALRDQFDQWQVDAILINNPNNRRWLTGFTGSFGYVILTRDRAILAPDGRYWTQARQQSPNFEVYEFVRKAGALAKLINSAGVKRIGLEAEVVTLQLLAEL